MLVDGERRLVWYAGRAAPGGPWRIGLAEALAGTAFRKHDTNPVLVPGATGSFDDRGVGDPEVVWDEGRRLFRMWYTAQGFLGLSSIGYAVSTDGVVWRKFPRNPVIDARALGLREVGTPTVLTEEGSLRMWLDGEPKDARGRRIYALDNTGAPFTASNLVEAPP
jgi:hypothetical protein